LDRFSMIHPCDGRTEGRKHVRAIAYMLSRVKTHEVRIMKFSPYGSPIPLVFAG